MAIIQCQNCGKNVSNKAKECPHCKSIINDTNRIENIINNVKVRTDTLSNKKTRNKVAAKFSMVVWFIRILGYFGGIISLIIYAQLDNFEIGLLVCVITCIVTWFSTLMFEAIGEGLQLLEDIKNK